jgi:hypothetical protein
MAVDITAVADVIVPELFTKYSLERTATAWALIQAGIVTRSAEFDALARQGGKTVNMPFFQDLSGRSEATPGDGSTELGVAKIASASDVAAVHYRSKAWGTNDLAGAMSSSDPLGAISSLVGDFWAREYQQFLLESLTGVFAAASMAAKINDVSVADVTVPANGVYMDETVFVDTIDLMGDASKNVTAIAMHSKVRNGLWKKKLLKTNTDIVTQAEVDYFLGRRIVVDDSLPKVAVTGGYKYTSYLFGQGAFAYGEGIPQNPVEASRENLKRNSLLVNDKILILHPRGVKWAATAAGNTPSDTELETGTSWVLAYEAKNVRIVSAVTNG